MLKAFLQCKEIKVSVFILILLMSFSAHGQDFEWSVSPILGMHKPNLKDINDNVIRAPIIGTGTSRGEPDTPQADVSFSIPLGFENDLDPIGWNANTGLEFQWKQSKKNYFLMGVSTWEGYSRGRTTGELPVQGDLFDVIYDRRIKISYNEFYFGLKHIFMDVPNKYRFYGRISLNELFDIDYREEHVFSINDVGGALDGVKRIFLVNGQITGVAGIQFGAGGEYYLKKNLSVAAEASYLLTEGDFQFTNASSQSDTQLGDDFSLSLPVSRDGVNDPLSYLEPDTVAATNWVDADNNPHPGYSPMNVSFDGWKASVRITLYY